LFSDQEVGILCCRSTDDRRFSVVVLRSAFRLGCYELDLFESRTRSWITKPVHVEPSQEQTHSFSCPTKVIAIGGEHGSSVAWADLCNGILIYDVLAGGSDTLRYIPLPLLLARNKMPRGASCDRDIAVGSNGTIKYFDMCIHAEAGSRVGSTYISKD
jgi:hypothetical protein